ncbi:protein C3orf33 homolog [Discoglossus pictus]
MADNPADNLISRVSQLADTHLYLVRNISTGLAVAGVILFTRSIRLTTKFTNANDIPGKFIKKNVKLRGKLICINERILEVEHVPISIPLISHLQRRWQPHGSLLVRLAGVELTDNGKIWLQEKLRPSETLWFQLLNREDSVLDCFIMINRKRLFNECLNVELVRQGLGKVIHIPGLQQDSMHYWKFYKRLLKAEVQAQKKGKGLWKEESHFELLANKIQNNIFVEHLKRLPGWVRNYLKKYQS